jgi:hypothetical protein
MTNNEAIINQTGSEKIYPGSFLPTRALRQVTALVDVERG